MDDSGINKYSSTDKSQEEVSLLSKIASIGEPNPDQSLHTPDVKPSSWRDNIGFWIAGLLNNFGYVVMLSAALDLLPQNLSPSIVLLTDILPSFIVQLTAPYFMNRIPYFARVIFCVLLAVTSFLLPAFCEPVGLKLLGVICASISSGFGEMTFLAYSSRYNKNTVSAWSSGTGGAGILGSFSYLGLKQVLSAKNTLLVSSPLPLGIALCYFLIITKPADLAPTALETNAPKPKKLPLMTQLRLLVRLLPFMIPLGLVYFGEYLINQGITPVLKFDHPNFVKDKKAYLYYQAIYQVGVFISRSSVNFLPIKSIYLLQLPAIFQMINAIFLSFVAVYNFIPTIYVIFGFIFWEGLLGGSIYVNTFYLMSQKFQGEEKEFCLGATTQAYGLSITLAAVVGIFYTPFLSTHRRV